MVSKTFIALLIFRIILAQTLWFFPDRFFQVMLFVFMLDMCDAVFTQVDKNYKFLDWVADLLSFTPLMVTASKVIPFFNYYPVYWFFNTFVMMFIAYEYRDLVLFKAPTYVILTSYIAYTFGLNSKLIYLSFMFSPVIEFVIHIWKRPKWYPKFVEEKIERKWYVFKKRHEQILAFVIAMIFQLIIAKIFIKI